MRLSSVLVIFLAIMLLLPLSVQAAGPDVSPLKVAWIYVAPRGDLGWSWAHDQGRLYVEQQLGDKVETAFAENIPEGPDAERVIRDFAQKGYKVIFTTSFGYGPATLAVAKEFPDVWFVHVSGMETASNVSTIFGRMEQARYLSGLVAGAATKTNIIGAVLAFPIPEVIRGINAFTLGVREVNPDAEVRVVWTNTWFGPQEEREAATALLAAGADVIAQHQDTTEPQKAAAEAGVFSIGYDSDMRQFVGDSVLASPVWNWGPKYTDIIQKVIAGTYTTESYYGGMDSGIVDLAPLSPLVSPETALLVKERENAIRNGHFVVFCGPMFGANGALVVEAGKCLTDQELLSMDYFVDGVKGEAPKEAPTGQGVSYVNSENPWVHQQVEAWMDCVDVDYGRIPADVAVKAGKLFESNTGMWLEDQTIAIKGKYVCWVGPSSDWKHEANAFVDYSQYALGPTLGEDHTHMESSRQTPNRFVALNTVYGQSWMIEASHELANVFNVDKTTQFFLAGWNVGLPFNIYPDLASAAPPTPFEFTGAGDTYNYSNFLRLFKSDPRIKLVDEVMNGPVWKDKNFPGHAGLMGLFEAAFATGNPIEGHLSRYAEFDDISAAASVHLYSEHENSDGTDSVPMQEVAWRKLTHGITLLLRADDAELIVPYLIEKGLSDWSNITLTTDDRAPDETLYDTYKGPDGVTYQIGGSKDNLLRAMRAGMPFEKAWQAGSINAAKYARVNELEGSVTPGKFASFMVLQNSPKNFDIKYVWVNGQKVVEEGKFIANIPEMDWSTYTGTVNTGNLTVDNFAVKADGTTAEVALLSPFYFEPDYKTATLPVVDGQVQHDLSQGIVKFSIIDRYHGTPNVANMFWTGVGPAEENAAFCETESHDNHYLQCLSTSDAAALVAIDRLKEIDGGYIAVVGGKIIGEVSLPIGGLMADRPAQQLADEFHAFWDALGQYKWLGGLNLEKVQRYATLTCDPWHWVLVTPFPGCNSGFVNVTTGECRPVVITQ